MKNKIIYLAIPYTFNPEKSFEIVNKIAAEMMGQGLVIFSPVSHSHNIAKHIGTSKRSDHEFWMGIYLPILRRCDELVLVSIGGDGENLLNNSKGCLKERLTALENKIPTSTYYYEE
jgi:hypothetical protein